MKNCRSLLPILVLFVLTFDNSNAQSSVAQEFMNLNYTYKGTTIPYRLYLPQDYSSLKKYPIVLSLHGAGERGTDNTKTLTSTFLATYWAEKNIQKKHPCLVVVPQLPDGMFWYQWMFEKNATRNYLEAANGILDALIKQYSIDKDRLYVIGFSMGGVSCWELASRYPKRFAAIVPISGTIIDPTVIDSLQTIPVWIFSGKFDDIFPAEIYYNFVTEIIHSGQSVVFPKCRLGVDLTTDYLSNEALRDSIDGGATFIYSEYSDIGHSNVVTERAYQDSLLSRWLFKQHRSDITTSSEINNSEIPAGFSLSQNYPNPFNPSTVISYQLPESNNVSLKVYDMLGREVAVLVNEYQPAGVYNYQFSIQNFQRSSGVYFYSLHAGNYANIKKMILMK